MHSFWGNVFDYFKDRRPANTFIAALVILLILLPIGICFYPLLVKGLPFAAVIFLGLLVRAIVRARRRWRDRYKISPLSRDELSKARSKLRKAKQ